MGEKLKITSKAYLSPYGVTTTAVLVDGLRRHFGANVDYYVPHRHNDGYGLASHKLIPFSETYDLIITGDTGIREFDSLDYVKENKADIIITDHHEPVIVHHSQKDMLSSVAVIEEIEDQAIALPNAFAVVNPHRLGDPYPNKSLSGVAVVFKLLQALFVATNKPLNPLYHYLDYVATGLIADLVPQIHVHRSLHGEYVDMEVRSMTALGLRIMNQHPKPWVDAMRSLSGVSDEWMSSHLGFTIGPRLNAVGRLGDPSPAVSFLLSTTIEEALEHGQILDRANNERKVLQKEASEAILENLETKSSEWTDYACVVMAEDPAHHSGIAGLIASDLQKKYYRTSLVLCQKKLPSGERVLTGSARSIEGVSVIKCLSKTQEKIGEFRHGGHKQAAGMTLTATESHSLEERFEAFRIAFRDAVKEVATEEDFIELITYNAEVPIEDVTLGMIENLQVMEPFGVGNKEPLFCSKGIELAGPPESMGNGTHCRLTFSQNQGRRIEAVAWGGFEEILSLYEECLIKQRPFILDAVYTCSVNRYRPDHPKPQLIIQSLRLASI